MATTLIEKTKNYFVHYFDDWTAFEEIWLAIFTIVTIGLFIVTKDTWFGLIAALTGMLCVVLDAKGKISNYYVGIPNILFYAYIAWQNKFYGEVQLNMLYFLPMTFVGIYIWKKNINKKKTKDDVLVRTLSNRQRAFWTVVTIIATIGYGAYLTWLNGNLPYIDALTAILSIIAEILYVMRYVEQWLIWILIDVLTIFMWIKAFATTGDSITILIMWVAFLFNAVYGFINWLKLYKQQKAHKT